MYYIDNLYSKCRNTLPLFDISVDLSKEDICLFSPRVPGDGHTQRSGRYKWMSISGQMSTGHDADLCLYWRLWDIHTSHRLSG